MKKIIWIFLAVILFVLLTASLPSKRQVFGNTVGNVDVELVNNGNLNSIYRIIDHDYKVVCWEAYGAGGIDCISMSELEK